MTRIDQPFRWYRTSGQVAENSLLQFTVYLLGFRGYGYTYDQDNRKMIPDFPTTRGTTVTVRSLKCMSSVIRSLHTGFHIQENGKIMEVFG